jgi:hypothetical protein
MNNKILFIMAIVLVTLVAGGYYFSDRGNSVNNTKEVIKKSGFGVGQKVVMYKSPNCGCCVGYADELENQGFEVEVVPTDDMNSIKDKYGIPSDKQSCHTIVLGDYFIEGHVPMEAVEKLLKEQPEVDGIGLPRMPAGAPGMGGSKRAPYEVYKAKAGEFSEFVTI